MNKKNQVKIWKMVAKLKGWDQSAPRHCTVWGMAALYGGGSPWSKENKERFEEHAEQCQYCFLKRLDNV